MPLLRSRATVHRARARTVIRLFAALTVTLAVLVALVVLKGIWRHA